jgi:HEAT repeat protein
MPRKHRDNKDLVKKKIIKLMPNLKNECLAIRLETLKELGSLGKDALSVTRRLLPLVEDEEELVRSYTLQALVDIGIEAPKVAKLVRDHLLVNKNQYVRARGYWILERIEN